MKKVIFALAAVVALAACSQEDVIVADKGAAIGFDTFVENSTRSVNDPSYTNSSMFSDFAVYGYVNGAVLLDGVRVAKNGADMDVDDYAGQTNTDWKYEGTQYWIAGANYNFNAVAPKTNGGWTKVDDGTNKDATLGKECSKTVLRYKIITAKPIAKMKETELKELLKSIYLEELNYCCRMLVNEFGVYNV